MKRISAAIFFFAVASVAAGQDGPAYRRQLNDVWTSYDKAFEEYSKPNQNARTPELEAKIKSLGAFYLPKFRRLAERGGESYSAYRAWTKSIKIAEECGDGESEDEITDLVIARFMNSPWFDRFTSSLIGSFASLSPGQRDRKVGGMLMRIENSSPSLNVKAAALYTRAKLNVRDGQNGAEAIKEIFREVVAKYPNTKEGKRAIQDIYEMESLTVGKQAPDFEAADQDGVKFKLSDYHGKVVVLDFWGMWCGPCRRSLPSNVDLVNRLKGKPFALVGINSDGSLAVLRKAITDQKLNYRNVWGGSTSGAIASKWNVRSWPMVYVIDADGIIRNKLIGFDGPAPLTKAVEDALKAIENKPSPRFRLGLAGQPDGPLPR